MISRYLSWMRRRLGASFYRSSAIPIPAMKVRRRLIVVISIGIVVSLLLTALVSKESGLPVWLITAYAIMWFSWNATRNMVVAHDAPLDERQREQVAHAYRIGFRIVWTSVAFLGAFFANLDTLGIEVGPVAFDRIAWVLFIGGFYAVPWAPIAILGWNLADEDVFDEEVADGSPRFRRN